MPVPLTWLAMMQAKMTVTIVCKVINEVYEYFRGPIPNPTCTVRAEYDLKHADRVNAYLAAEALEEIEKQKVACAKREKNAAALLREQCANDVFGKRKN